MANLSDLFGGSGEGGSITFDPLPTFAVWSNASNVPYFSVIDSSFGRINSGRYTTDSELYVANSSSIYTNANFGSSAYSTGTTSSGGMTCFQQVEGHWQVNPPYRGSYNNPGNTRLPTTHSGHWPFFGVTINPYGVRQKQSLFVSGSTMRTYPFAATTHTETFNWTTHANVSGTPGNTTSGMLSYNYNTDTLVLLTSGGGSSYRVHVWKHPNYKIDGTDGSSGSILKFVSDARNNLNGASYKYNTIDWNTTSFGSYSESQYHLRVILGDNDKVGLVRFTPSNQTVKGVFTIGNNASTPTVTTQQTLSVTTSYGIEQGNLYGLRHNISWDNKWVIAYSPYYYYGCGAKVFIVSTEDPTLHYSYSYDDTSNGVGIAPFQESAFIFSYHSSNNDGNVGQISGVFDPSRFKDAGQPTGTGFGVSYNNQNIDTGSTSTNYSWLVPMSSFAGGVEKY